MSMVSNIPLSEIMPPKSGSVDPSKFPDESFDLYSIPAYDAGQPEVAFGRQIGSAKQIVQPGDVLLSRIVPHIRRAWVVGDNRGRRIIASGEWIVFRSDRFHPSYLRHLLVAEPFYARFMQTVAGVGGSLLRARPAQVADIEIPMRPIFEQQRVSVQLEKADRLRHMRRYALQMCDEYLSAAFNSIFGSEVECLKRWPVSRLDDCCHRITDGTHLTPKFQPAGVPFIFVKNIDNGNIDFRTDKFISEETYHQLYSRCPVKRGDILYSIVGATYGQAVLVGDFTKFAFQRHIAHLKPNDQVVLPKFLASVMQFPVVKTQADRWARGAAQPTINLKELKEFKVPLPPLLLQEQFVALAERRERVRSALRESLRQTDHLFQTLLHQAFSS